MIEALIIQQEFIICSYSPAAFPPFCVETRFLWILGSPKNPVTGIGTGLSGYPVRAGLVNLVMCHLGATPTAPSTGEMW